MTKFLDKILDKDKGERSPYVEGTIPLIKSLLVKEKP